MTAQPEHHDADVPLIARPDRTPRALRVALAQVLPHRIQEFQEQEDEVLALAAATGSLGPVVQFLRSWAAVVEVARFPREAARLRAAEHAAQVLDKDDPRWRTAMAQIREITEAAYTAVGE